MAIKGNDGGRYSFESTALINELKMDIQEYGNIKFAAYYKMENGAKLYFDYQFVADKDAFSGNYDIVQADYLLKYFEKQNKIM